MIIFDREDLSSLVFVSPRDSILNNSSIIYSTPALTNTNFKTPGDQYSILKPQIKGLLRPVEESTPSIVLTTV